jgi:hypothetical protein
MTAGKVAAAAVMSAPSEVGAAVSTAGNVAAAMYTATMSAPAMRVSERREGYAACSQGQCGRAHDKHTFQVVFHWIFSKEIKYKITTAEMVIRSEKKSEIDTGTEGNLCTIKFT